jgi:predicted O-methyltransferase YrrM
MTEHYEDFVPSPPSVIREKFRFADVQPEEKVLDMGSGDGEPLIICAREFGAHCVGIEIRPEYVDKATEAARVAGVADQVEFRCEDFSNTDVSEADVVFIYLTRGTMGPLSIKLENELPAGARIVTHTFDLPGWTAAKQTQFSDETGMVHDLYLYSQRSLEERTGEADAVRANPPVSI